MPPDRRTLDLDEYHARFARVATLAYAHRFAQAGRELRELTSRPRPAGLTISDTIIELSVLAEIRRGDGQAEAALDAITEAASAQPTTRRLARSMTVAR
jgi:hypothetical protein